MGMDLLETNIVFFSVAILMGLLLILILTKITDCKIVNLKMTDSGALPPSDFLETYGSVTVGQYASGTPPGCDEAGWTVFRGLVTHAYVEKTAGGLFNMHSDATEFLRWRNNYLSGGILVNATHPTLIITFKPGPAYTNGDYIDFYLSDDGTNYAITTTSWEGRLLTLDGSNRSSGFGGTIVNNMWNYSTQVEFKFVFDFTAHTYDIYVDNIIRWTDEAFYSVSCNYIGRITWTHYTQAARDTELIKVEVP